MAKQTPRGIPTPESGDPDNVPAFFQRLVSFLDPGSLVDYNPTQVTNGRIVFLTEGDGTPTAIGLAVELGTVYVDRSTARLWLPMTQLVNGVDTLAWYRLGADLDAEIATLTGELVGVVRNADQTDTVVAHDTVALVLTGILPGTSTNIWDAGITFDEPFSKVPTIVVSNGDAVNGPNVLVGVQNVTASGFQVQITRSDVPFQLNDQVTITYFAIA